MYCTVVNIKKPFLKTINDTKSRFFLQYFVFKYLNSGNQRKILDFRIARGKTTHLRNTIYKIGWHLKLFLEKRLKNIG